MEILMEKVSLDFIQIDGKYYGGDQNWHSHKIMKIGGCSAVTVCETCIYLAKTGGKYKGLYPFDPANVTKQDFLDFFEIVFRYVYPGVGGLASVKKFERMMGEYIKTTGVDVDIFTIEGAEPYEKAEAFIREALDGGLPVMYLMLKHKDIAFDDYEWHWFTVTGYEQTAHGFFVDFATWGEKHRFSLERAWDTGKAKRGGMVFIR